MLTPAISASVPRVVRYDAAPGQTDFPIPFAYLEQAGVRINVYVAGVLINALVGGDGDMVCAPVADAVLVSGVAGVATIPACAGDEVVEVYAETTAERDANYSQTGPFRAEMVNREFNRRVAVETELQRDGRGTVRLAPDQAFGRRLDKGALAGNVLGFDLSGEPIAAGLASLGSTPVETSWLAKLLAPLNAFASVFMQTVLGAATAHALAKQVDGAFTVQTYAALTALAAPAENVTYTVLGRSARGDGGAGKFYFVADSVAAANGATVLAINGGGPGRFFRIYEGGVFARWFAANLNTAVQQASDAGFKHILVDQDFAVTAKITLGAGVVLEGTGRQRPLIVKGANIDMLDMSATDCGLRFLNVQGLGATYTGRGVVIGGGIDQFIDDCYLLDHNGFALEFTAADAGQRFRASRSLFRRTTPTNPAIALPTGVSETAGNRYFDQCGGLGGTLLAFRHGINTILTGCNFTNLDFSGSSGISLRAIISGCRGALLGGSLTISGGDVSIEGGVWAGDIVLDASTQRCRIRPGGLLAGVTITDNSTATGDSVNEIWDGYYSPTPLWKADTTDPVLGNGSLAARVYRSGRRLHVSVTLAIGSTTTLGVGAWYFQLPAPFSNWVAKAGEVGSARIFDNGTTYFGGIPAIGAGSARIYLWRDNSPSNVHASSPMLWATGDTLVFSIEYEIA